MTRSLFLYRCLILLISLKNTSCLVDEKCNSDLDCKSPKICSPKGECIIQCNKDSDCDISFGAAYICDNYRCTMPNACTICVFINAQSSCIHGICTMEHCDAGFYNLNNSTSDGCEYTCSPSGDEVADHIDNDCDGLIDEDTDLNSDVLNCGSVGNVCPSLPYASPICNEGKCSYQCYAGWRDDNGLPDDGCETKIQSLCPNDMVAIGSAFCIDKYEASRADATESDQGINNSIAISQPGVLPWMVDEMTTTHFNEFKDACQAAGKHLCSKEEWFAACTGSQQNNYVYGNIFNRETCNCVDTFCDDFCVQRSISPCDTTTNCGYTYYYKYNIEIFHEVPTAQFSDCTNDYGTLDINGNVWEIVTSTNDLLNRGYEIRGGAFNCASASARVNCSFNATWSTLYAGFRCCKQP
ncbi:MAG: SUMF1/EgtB/PvdO family nonheme iron enzyme [Deltaproteobacteria bacterium]|nr:SUMF1/EgtB/PvdO family nonheme iron enzyme [Deltaproteobacteria bacterium]